MRGGARICAGFGLHNSDMQTALDARRIFRYHEPNDEVMTMQFLCAPMEGVTGDLFRQAQRQTFPAADSYYTPFLSPTANRTFSPRELREIDPAHNAGIHVVPQLMGHCAEDFLWMAGQLADMGYDEVNFNLGCRRTRSRRRKKARACSRSRSAAAVFDDVFAACPLPVSVKTRLGKTTAEGFPALLELYNDYPICELIVHPRVQADQYHGQPDLEAFAYALAHSRAPVCYNGDLFDAPAVHAFQARFPAVERVMLGRGLAANPGLIGQLRTGRSADGGAAAGVSRPALRCHARAHSRPACAAVSHEGGLALSRLQLCGCRAAAAPHPQGAGYGGV